MALEVLDVVVVLEAVELEALEELVVGEVVVPDEVAPPEPVVPPPPKRSPVFGEQAANSAVPSAGSATTIQRLEEARSISREYHARAPGRGGSGVPQHEAYAADGGEEPAV